MTPKIALIFSNFGPYHLARIDAFFNHSHNNQFSLLGIELARSQREYPWKTQVKNFSFPIVSVISEQLLEKTRVEQLIRHLYLVLEQVDPDILVISGYFRPGMLFTLLWSIWHH